MNQIKFKMRCNYKGKIYEKGDVLENVVDFVSVWRLNEKGFIEPLTKEEFIKLQSKKRKEGGLEDDK